MRPLFSVATVVLATASLVCCTPIENEKKPVGPRSSESNMPWNVPQAGQGQGSFGMIPQMNQRR